MTLKEKLNEILPEPFLLEVLIVLFMASIEQPGFESVEGRERREVLKHTTAYINAGGRGTRLETVLPKDAQRGITKALIDFKDQPILLYHVDRLERLGIGKIIILAGDHRNIDELVGEKLRTYPNVELRFEENQQGTGGDLIKAVQAEQGPNMYALISNVDTLLDVDEGMVLLQHKKSEAEATIVLTTRDNVPNQGAFLVDEKNRVIVNSEARTRVEDITPPEKYMWQGSSTGMVVINREVLSTHPWQPESGSLSVYGDLLGEIYRRDGLYAYDNGEKFFMDVGTPATYGKMKRHPVLKDILDHRSSESS